MKRPDPDRRAPGIIGKLRIHDISVTSDRNAMNVGDVYILGTVRAPKHGTGFEMVNANVEILYLICSWLSSIPFGVLKLRSLTTSLTQPT